MKNLFLFISVSIFFNSNIKAQTVSTLNPSSSDKVKVLNFATFHMGSTSDANSVEFDEENKKNQADAKQIAKMISDFKPTIICVEIPLNEQTELDVAYKAFLENSQNTSSYRGEVGLVAFEVGKIAGLSKIYGIDYEMGYNYNIRNEIENEIDPVTINRFYSNPFKYFPSLNVNENELSLLERLKIGNSQSFMDFIILINADMLTYVGSKEGYEGAEEAAKFYERNLKIFSNLNRIHTTKEDRIFILTGGSHAAFLQEFMERSPKYEVVNPIEYLDN